MKMQNENTTFIEKDCFKYEDRHTGAWIDIMPVYGLPQGSIKQLFCLNIMRYLSFSKSQVPFRL